ncbi:hypothetical protein [Paenibacillus sp. FSL R5-0914]|uniref:hypothetical protein n=1 Tax=Paenibacillus sp. FSL R5-0914 TaxID=2921665 RepID=UPI0030F7938F
MNIEIAQDNAVGRLYLILKQLKNEYTSPPLKVMAKLFDVDISDIAAILYNYAELFSLAKAIKDDINSIPNINHDRYISPIDTVILGLSKININASRGLEQFNTDVSSNVMVRLEYCAELLSRERKERVFNKAELTKLQQDIEDLIKEIDEMDKSCIDNEIKAFLISNLEQVRVAIINYKLWGSKGIKEILENSVGSIILHANSFEEVKDQKAGRKVLAFLTGLGSIVAPLKETKELVDSIAKLFLDK